MQKRLFIRHNLPFPVLLVLIFAVTTLPFRCHFPINWDAAQFVLGVRHFSIHMHQPHPPGYPLFIGLARIVDWAFDSPHLSVQCVTWAFALGAVLTLYWVVLSLWGNRWAAFLSGVGFLLNPLFWYYREAALTYTVDAFATLLIGGLSCLAFQGAVPPRRQFASAVALGLLGGVRPSLVLLLAPVALSPSVLQKRHQTTFYSLALFGMAILAWLIPLIALSGGLSLFVQTSARLAEQGTANTSVLLGAGIEQTRLQLAAVVDIMTTSCNLVLLPALLGACLYFRDLFLKKQLVAGLAFISLWTLPPLLVFVLIHLGQAGYLLILIPIVYVMGGRLWVELLRARRGWTKTAGLAGLTGLLFLHGLAFPLLSPEVWSAGSDGKWNEDLQRIVERKAGRLGQYSAAVIRRNDDKITALTEIIRSYPVSGTLVITAPPLSGTSNDRYDPQPDAFRELGTTCPEYRIFLLAPQPHTPLCLHRFQTAYLRDVVRIPNGGSRVLLLLDEIPPHLMPGDLQVVRKSGPTAYYIGFAEAGFEFLGVRFQPVGGPAGLFSVNSN